MKKGITTILSAIIVIGVWSYQPLKSWQLKRCQSKYGKEFNKERKTFMIPAIPEKWKVFDRNDNATFWGKLNSDEVGYKRKTVIFDGCDVKEEQDVYRLPVKDGEKRWIEISYSYNRAVKDSIYYQIGQFSKPISRLKMDSILDAEHINKGY